MKREILIAKPFSGLSGCCPGHDTYPTETYGNRRSKKARARDKALEHQHARSIAKRNMLKDITDHANNLA